MVENFREHKHEENEFFLFTHLVFSISYNGDHVIACNITTDSERRKLLKFDEDVSLYSHLFCFMKCSNVWIDPSGVLFFCVLVRDGC